MNNVLQLIDLNQTIFIPVTDDSQGGLVREVQTTVGDFFADFLDEFKPEIVDAIPTNWLNRQIEFAKVEGFKEPLDAYQFVKDSWEKTRHEWKDEHD